ncbi:right-handed parallel beta-helix repeat-containing protein [Phenylobacterium sp.]|uniref:right-handed parallel beta-helix repeat-containing protein n=1 Tax=Phenylobacterium sp. TaxID=1871053 RepID=UPI002C6FF0F9|nr:right-handed parallel beta-helix repeat-containing protein [Phenylobacterium sp.]HLZ75517.1 right-handed parallel beta-helix repeat-containing protein [Phenylobacterium sp.]
MTMQDDRSSTSEAQGSRPGTAASRIGLGLAALLPALAFAVATHASTITATSGTLVKALSAVKPGDTLALSGAFQDVTIADRSFSPALNITCADPEHPATVRSLVIKEVAGLHMSCVSVAFTPDEKTVSFSSAVSIEKSSDISLTAMKIVGGPAVSGVPETALAGDKTGNVIGRPAGRGITISYSHDVSLVDSEITFFHRSLVLATVANVTVRRNDFHDHRTTAIAGSNLTDVVIDHNTIRGSNPWRWGQTPVGDHADCLAFWSDAKQTTPNARVSISNNRMEQLSGAAILGMWFQGTPAAPFTDAKITGNTFVIPNLQGIALWNTVGGLIADNFMVQAPVAGVDPKQRPTILLRAGVTGLVMKSNHVSSPISDTSGGANTTIGNVVMTGNVKIPS